MKISVNCEAYIGELHCRIPVTPTGLPVLHICGYVCRSGLPNANTKSNIFVDPSWIDDFVDDSAYWIVLCKRTVKSWIKGLNERYNINIDYHNLPLEILQRALPFEGLCELIYNGTLIASDLSTNNRGLFYPLSTKEREAIYKLTQEND